MIRLLAMFGLALAIVGCGSEPRTYRVKGTVSWNGTPIADGRINFVAPDGQTQPASSKITDGVYEVRVAPGTKRIEVYGQRSKGYDKVMKQETFEGFVPPEYNAKSVLTFEVQPNDDNTLDLALPRKK